MEPRLPPLLQASKAALPRLDTISYMCQIRPVDQLNCGTSYEACEALCSSCTKWNLWCRLFVQCLMLAMLNSYFQHPFFLSSPISFSVTLSLMCYLFHAKAKAQENGDCSSSSSNGHLTPLMNGNTATEINLVTEQFMLCHLIQWPDNTYTTVFCPIYGCIHTILAQYVKINKIKYRAKVKLNI